jgi:proline iminopeptidase
MINTGCAEVLLLNSLTSKKSSGEETVVGVYDLDIVTKENYLSGEAFCKEYVLVTSREYGKKVQAPAYYDGSSAVTQIYAWTNLPFDPSKPSVLLFDGGPGQNLHAYPNPDAAANTNFIHLDQRGMGCSAPETFEIYKNPKFYASQFIIQDADAVRKAYGIDKWSVYGVSYGTVLATMYANRYPNATRSALLEGVYYSGTETHAAEWKVKKLNLMLDKLTKGQRSSFVQAITSENKSNTYLLFKYEMSNLWYAEDSFQNFQSLIQNIISENGNINEDKVEAKINELTSGGVVDFKKPQKPKAIDRQFNLSIMCQDLSDWAANNKDLGILIDEEKFTVTELKRPISVTCQEENIPVNENNFYVAKNYPVNVPIYYFQGTHDGATLATGALKHWQTVPQSAVTMMLNQRGGHNPFLTDLYLEMNMKERGGDTSLKQEYISSNIERLSGNAKVLFENAVNAKPLLQSQVDALNVDEPKNEKWLLYGKAPKNMASIESEFNGVKIRDFIK